MFPEMNGQMDQWVDYKTCFPSLNLHPLEMCLFISSHQEVKEWSEIEAGETRNNNLDKIRKKPSSEFSHCGNLVTPCSSFASMYL